MSKIKNDITPMLSTAELGRLCNVSRAVLERLLDTGVLPVPVQLGPRIRRWRQDEVEAALDRLKVDRDAE